MSEPLDTLPPEHPLRNRPLRDIGAQRRNRDGVLWLDVGTWKIGPLTFNELGAVWHEHGEFRATKETA